MAARKTQRQLADEAYVRNQQTTIHDDVPVPARQEWPELKTIPPNRPECRANWSPAGGVTPLLPAEERQFTFLAQIQCGKCGHVFLVQPEDHAALRAAILRDHESRKRPPLPKKAGSKRERGAG